jgi:hypothetical protein
VGKESWDENFTNFFAIFMCFAGYLASLIFFLWCFLLLLTNQTTIELYDNLGSSLDKSFIDNNPYFVGAAKNLYAVLGTNPCFNLFIPNWKAVHNIYSGNGLVFPLSNGRGIPLMLMNDPSQGNLSHDRSV